MLGSDWPAKTNLSYRVACLGYLGYLIAATKLDQCKGNPWVEGVKAGSNLEHFLQWRPGLELEVVKRDLTF